VAMRVLGVSALYHDASAAVMVDGRIVSAAQEERFSRVKQDRTVPWRAVRSCLDSAELSIADLDVLAYYEDPAMKLDRQMSMLTAEERADVAAELAQRAEPQRVYRAPREGRGFDAAVRFVPHHMSHAAHARTSPTPAVTYMIAMASSPSTASNKPPFTMPRGHR
jgi:carbamoyltransferase